MGSMSRSLFRTMSPLGVVNQKTGEVVVVKMSLRQYQTKLGKARKRAAKANHRRAMAFAAEGASMDRYHERIAERGTTLYAPGERD